MELSAEAQATLAALGTFDGCQTAEDVANVLRERGIKGTRLSGFSCPMALFLDQETGNSVHLVCAQSVEVSGRGVSWSTETPPSVKSFILAFDDGKFPDLIAT
jgi:hypothetical protein